MHPQPTTLRTRMPKLPVAARLAADTEVPPGVLNGTSGHCGWSSWGRKWWRDRWRTGHLVNSMVMGVYNELDLIGMEMDRYYYDF